MTQQTADRSARINLKLVQVPNDDAPLSIWRIENGLMTYTPFANSAGKLTGRLEEAGKLRLDNNGDGTLDGKDDPPFLPSNTLVAVDFKLGDKTVRYPFCVIGMAIPQHIAFRPLAALEGSYNDYTIRFSEKPAQYRGVSFGGQNEIIELSPRGQFFGVGGLIQVYRQGSDPLTASSTHPWSPYLQLDGAIVKLEYLAETGQLQVTPYSGPLAQLKLDVNGAFPSSGAIIEGSDQSGWVSAGSAGAFIPGSYRVTSVYLAIDKKNPSNLMPGLFPNTAKSGKESPITLKEGMNALRFGPPLTLSCSFRNSNGKLTITKADLLGVAGERYTPSDKQADGSFEWFLRTANNQKSLGKLGFG